MALFRLQTLFLVVQGANFYASAFEGNNSQPLGKASTPSIEPLGACYQPYLKRTCLCPDTLLLLVLVLIQWIYS